MEMMLVTLDQNSETRNENNTYLSDNDSFAALSSRYDLFLVGLFKDNL